MPMLLHNAWQAKYDTFFNKDILFLEKFFLKKDNILEPHPNKEQSY